mgnify:CR=1 FL=1
MSKHSDQVVLGFMRLSAEDRADAIKKMNDFLDTAEPKKSVVMESFRVKAGLDLGPLNQGGCRCCGK